MLTSKINFNGIEINHIKKIKLKNSYISISNGEVYLKTPKVSKKYIEDLLHTKESWIRKKVIESKEKIYVDKDSINIGEAKEYMQSRVTFLSNKMDLKYSELKFRKMKRRWGSCSSTKKITLNLYLYLTNNELMDYVIVHELSHLVHMNHSKKFHAFVQKYMPNAKSLNKELNNYSCS